MPALVPVTTPRLAASDCMISAKMRPTRITQRSCRKVQSRQQTANWRQTFIQLLVGSLFSLQDPERVKVQDFRKEIMILLAKSKKSIPCFFSNVESSKLESTTTKKETENVPRICDWRRLAGPFLLYQFYHRENYGVRDRKSREEERKRGRLQLPGSK